MPESTELESGQEQVNSEQAAPKFTDASADKQVSTYDPAAIAKQVAEILRPEFQKTAQQTKDKRFSKIEEALGLRDLEEMGVQIPDNVKQEMRFRALENRDPQQQMQKPSQASGADASADWSKVVAEVGLDTNSPDYIALLRGEYRNLDHFTAEAYRVKARQTSQPNPDLSTESTLKGDGGKTFDQNALLNEYNELSKFPSKNIARLKELEETLKQNGVW
jgi:hypothetical protein